MITATQAFLCQQTVIYTLIIPEMSNPFLQPKSYSVAKLRVFSKRRTRQIPNLRSTIGRKDDQFVILTLIPTSRLSQSRALHFLAHLSFIDPTISLLMAHYFSSMLQVTFQAILPPWLGSTLRLERIQRQRTFTFS